MKRLLAALCIALFWPHAPRAAANDFAIQSVQDLMIACRDVASDYQAMSESQFARVTRCLNFINGYWQGFDVAAELFEQARLPAQCVSAMQWGALYLNWAERHPEAWHRPAGSGLALSLMERDPCASFD
jgi:peptidoglycan/xylan/chitin deacetylase (PgdA/CDA1 family)